MLQTVTPHLLRELFAGRLDMDALPAMLKGQLQAVAARIQRQAGRRSKREHHAQRHMLDVGTRATTRRARQIADGRLTAANGLVT